MDFTRRARSSLLDFQESVGRFREKVAATIPSRQLPEKRLRKLGDLAEEATAAALPLLDSLARIEQTALDIVDMETRMIGQTGALAEVLEELGREVRAQYFVRETFQDELVELEERAQLVAGSLFPSAVQALNFVNSKIWEFSRLQKARYLRLLEKKIEDEELKGKALSQMQETFRRLEDPFENADRFLNELATRSLRRRGVIARRAFVRRALAEAQRVAAKAAEERPFRHFKSVLKETARIAAEVSRRIEALRIPLFPTHEELEELKTSISSGLYQDLTGLQTFALLNIASRMREIQLNNGHLLSATFGVRIWKVFPDRIYFDARGELLDALRTSGEFEGADPALHRFRDGSLKQRTHAQGNLQLSYRKKPGGSISVDADIDLYRDPLRHFFGEVLVNHLTGGKTDPYRVREILDQQGVRPVGGFEIYPE